MSKTIYLKGSAKEVEFPNGGSVINISLNKEEIASLPDTKGYVNITVAQRREEDRFGNSHYVKLNDYTPKSKQVSKEDETDDLPF